VAVVQLAVGLSIVGDGKEEEAAFATMDDMFESGLVKRKGQYDRECAGRRTVGPTIANDLTGSGRTESDLGSGMVP
jgi:hypothetical protein